MEDYSVVLPAFDGHKKAQSQKLKRWSWDRRNPYRESVRQRNSFFSLRFRFLSSSLWQTI